ncbi:MAG: F0F1 ATP synthase subunit delta [Gallionellaceae bacterium]|jgi:F-type H+-transporting ATPase subunit delta|nr:F0F1 ATP synthase subunit delta [Gallionellaceae bacterium]
MAEAITIARPYAQAAFDEASRAGKLKDWSDMLQSLAEAAANAEVREVITSPRVPRKQVEGLMLALGGKQLDVTQQNFIRVLAENQRLTILTEIAALFEMLRADAEKNVDVTVTSAFDLNDTQKQKIAAAMKARTGREVRLHCEIDKSLLGGVVIRAGDQVIDGSARTRLSELAHALA